MKLIHRVLLLLFLVPLKSYATDYKLIELETLFLDYKKFHESNRDPLFYNSTKKEEVSVNIESNIMSFIYWDSKVHGETNNAQYNLVGLETRLGIRITKSFEFGLYHHSQHLLDDKYPYMKFPVDDAVQIRIYLYGNSKRGAFLE